MCISCGCGEPMSDHGDSRHITLTDLRSAAEAAGLSVGDAAGNIAKAVANVGKRIADDTDEGLAACRVVKTTDERRYTLGVAYPANKADVGVAGDGHIDFVGIQALEDAAWAFMRKGAQVGLYHRKGTDGAGTVVESYIYRGEPWHIKAADDTEHVVMPGDWLVGVVWREDTWPLVKDGAVRGFSPQGGAARRRPTAEDLAALRER